MRRLSLFAGVLTLCILGAGAAMATDLLNEPFTSSAGSFVLSNGGADAGTYWYWLNSCPANTLTGHTAPGALRWGTNGNCNLYGNNSTMDTAAITVNTASCTANDIVLSFKYLLAFQESYWDRAWVTVGGTNVACYANYPSSCPLQLQSTNTWQPATINIAGNPGSLVIVFNGQTLDGAINSWSGFYIDDVIVSCTTGGGGTCATPQQVALIEAKMDAAGDVLNDIGTAISDLGGRLEAKLDILEPKIDGVETQLDDQTMFQVDQALLVCGCAPSLYLPEARGGMESAAIAHVRAMHTAVAASGDPDEARDLADADCYIKLAQTLASGGRHKVACMALSTAMQLLDGHTERPGYHPRGVEDQGSEHLCLAECQVPQ